MANELRAHYLTGKTMYAVVMESNGQLYNGSAFETPLAAHWSTYAVAVTEQSTTGFYFGNMPGSLASGIYDAWFFLQASGSPATTDPCVGKGTLDWSGSADLGINTYSTIAGVAFAEAIKYIGAAVAGTAGGIGTSTESYNDFSGALAFSVTYDSNNNRLTVTYY